MERFELGQVPGLRGRHSPVRPIGPARAQARFLERANVRHGVVVAADIVALVVHRRGPRVDRLGRGQPSAVVHVFGAHHLAIRRGHREVSLFGLITGHGAEKRGPHVPVRVDQAGQHNHSARVENRGAGGFQVFPHGGNFAALDVHVAAGNVAERRVHRQYVAIADQELSPRG